MEQLDAKLGAVEQHRKAIREAMAAIDEIVPSGASNTGASSGPPRVGEPTQGGRLRSRTAAEFSDLALLVPDRDEDGAIVTRYTRLDGDATHTVAYAIADILVPVLGRNATVGHIYPFAPRLAMWMLDAKIPNIAAIVDSARAPGRQAEWLRDARDTIIKMMAERHAVTIEAFRDKEDTREPSPEHTVKQCWNEIRRLQKRRVKRDALKAAKARGVKRSQSPR